MLSRDIRNQLEGDINAQLREACQEGEEYEVKRLLKEGADSYACDEVLRFCCSASRDHIIYYAGRV